MLWDQVTLARVAEGCDRCTALPPPFCPEGRTYSLTTATRNPSEDPGVFPRDGEIARLESHRHFCPHVVHCDSLQWGLHLIVLSEPSISHTSWVQNPVFKLFTCAPKFLMFSSGPVFCLPSKFWSLHTTDCVSFVQLLSVCSQAQARLCESRPCKGPSMVGASREGALWMSSRHQQPGIYNIKFWHLPCFTKFQACKLGLYACSFHFVHIKLYWSW